MSQNLYTQHTSTLDTVDPADNKLQDNSCEPLVEEAPEHHTPTPSEIYGHLNERPSKKPAPKSGVHLDPYAHARRHSSRHESTEASAENKTSSQESCPSPSLIYGKPSEARRPFSHHHTKNHSSDGYEHHGSRSSGFHKYSNSTEYPHKRIAKQPAHSLDQDAAILQRFKELMDPENPKDRAASVTAHTHGAISSDSFASPASDHMFAEERILKNGSANHGNEVKVMIRRRRTIVRPEE